MYMLLKRLLILLARKLKIILTGRDHTGRVSAKKLVINDPHWKQVVKLKHGFFSQLTTSNGEIHLNPISATYADTLADLLTHQKLPKTLIDNQRQRHYEGLTSMYDVVPSAYALRSIKDPRQLWLRYQKDVRINQKIHEEREAMKVKQSFE